MIRQLLHGELNKKGIILYSIHFSGANSASEADPDLFVPILSHSIFLKSLRKFFRFGVPFRRKGSAANGDKENMTSQNLLRYTNSEY